MRVTDCPRLCTHRYARTVRQHNAANLFTGIVHVLVDVTNQCIITLLVLCGVHDMRR